MSRRILRSLFSLWLTCTVASPLLAGDQTFPYQAAVVAEKVEVRCGPGSQFYVTGRLGPQDMVTVRRHDHGGWYMIDPPPGSISWLDAECVKRLGPDRGVIELAPQDGVLRRAIVRIGSQFGDEHSYSGRELFNGDEVTILGEQTLHGPHGPARMLKIVPPAQEFRWVKGEFLVPVSRQVQQQIASDPYQVPAEHRQRLVAEGKFLLTPPPTREVAAKEVESEAESPDRKQLMDQFAQLDRIDQQYAALMSQPPEKWHLDPIVASYRQLHSQAGPKIATLIDQRLEVVAQRQQIAGHYQRFLQVASEASQVDAQLLGTQASYQPMQPVQQAISAPVAGPPEMALMSGDAPPFLTAPPAPNSPPNPAPQMAPQPTIAPASAEAAAMTEDPAALVAKFTGAGIVQPVTPTPGIPPFALVTPEGKLLTYLAPQPGVSMESWLGKPVGIIGPRAFDPRVSGDIIQVEKVAPVQLMR